MPLTQSQFLHLGTEGGEADNLKYFTMLICLNYLCLEQHLSVNILGFPSLANYLSWTVLTLRLLLHIYKIKVNSGKSSAM